MRTMSFLVLFSAAVGCTSSERTGRETGGAPEPETVEPGQADNRLKVPTLFAEAPGPGFVDCIGALDREERIRSLCLRDRVRNLQFRAMHLPNEVAAPGDVLLRNVKAYWRQMEPEKQFPKIQVSDDGQTAFHSVRSKRDGWEIAMTDVYRKLSDLPGIVMVHGAHGTLEHERQLSNESVAELERMTRDIATGIRIEMRPAPATQ